MKKAYDDNSLKQSKFPPLNRLSLSLNFSNFDLPYDIVWCKKKLKHFQYPEQSRSSRNREIDLLNYTWAFKSNPDQIRAGLIENAPSITCQAHISYKSNIPVTFDSVSNNR